MTLEFNPLTTVLSILGALAVAGLVGWIKHARLVVLVPKTFSYSELTDKGHGQLVEVAVFNRGWKTEDSIDVIMNPALTYQMLGANSQDVKVEDNRLKISRIAPSDEITALLIVEKGTFRRDDIVQIVSKESKGLSVSKAEEIGLTGPQRIQLVIILILMLLLGGAFYLFFQSIGTPTTSQTSQAVDKGNELPAKIGDWNIESPYRSKENILYQSMIRDQIKLVVSTPVTKGDYTSIPVRIVNNASTPLLVSLTMNTNASLGRIPSYDLRSPEILVPAQQTVEKSVKVVIPGRNPSVADRTVYIEAFLKSVEGETLQLKQLYVKPN